MAVTVSTALAQNCLDGDFGTLIATNPQDIVLPIQPIGFPFPINGVTYTDCHITDHGYVQLSNAGVPAPIPAPAVYTPTTANFVGGSPKVCAIYADIIGAGGGSIYINSTPTRCLITWLSMQNYGYTTPRYDFQLALYPTGDFKIVWGPGVTNISTFGFPSDNGIVGATPGNNVALPAASDLSVGGNTLDPTVFELWTTPSTFDLASREMMFLATNPGYVFVNNGAPTNCAATSNYGTGCDGLTMTGVGRPSIGNSNYKLNITGVPLVSPIALAAFGTVVINPGAPLSVIGMAGCSAYTNLDIGMFTAGPVVAQTSSFPLAIPPSPAIVGTVLSAQALSLSLFTAAGLASSNGTQITVGNGL